MKNQYFGDVNDYRKYGLLRAFQSSRRGRLLVAWMLTPDDGGGDGGASAYLERPEKFRHHDPELFDALAGMLNAGTERNVALLERSKLLPDTEYYADEVPDGREAREAWGKRLPRHAAGVDLVFLDPDNGIEVRTNPWAGKVPPSTSPGKRSNGCGNPGVRC